MMHSAHLFARFLDLVVDHSGQTRHFLGKRKRNLKLLGRSDDVMTSHEFAHLKENRLG